jgi:hypothetical protein
VPSLHSFPTRELCDFLLARIGGRSAIEIGAGHGALAKALSIPATDNRQQEKDRLKAYYREIGQPTVPYGDHVERWMRRRLWRNTGPVSSLHAE